MKQTKVKKDKALISPRGYLSWTQIDMWLRSPELYVERYMYGKEDIRTDRMDFGSKVALALENGEATDDELVNQLVLLLPRLKGEVREHEIKVPVTTKAGNFYLLGKLDKFSSLNLSFREVKTGVTKWTQRRAEGHRQIDHYTTLIWLKHHKLPEEIHLDWAPTECLENGSVVLVGGVHSFQVKKTLRDVLEYLALASRVAVEIDKRYREELAKMS